MADLLTDDLNDFLWHAARRGFAWGAFDCLSWFGAWIAIRHGINPAMPLTSYSTQAGAHRLVASHGGLAGVVDHAVAPLGILRTADPRRGDVAIVQARDGAAGAIVTGSGVACLTLTGLIVGPAPILTAWRV